MTKERFISFTDAIIAIVATIMVLDLPRPENLTAAEFVKILPNFFVYCLSFFMIWMVWVNHHALFHNVQQINTRIVWLTGFWLFFMSLFPWVTAEVGLDPSNVIPELFYLIIMLLWGIMYSVVEREVIWINPHVKENASVFRRTYRVAVITFTALGFIIIWFWPYYPLLVVLFDAMRSFIVQFRRNGKLG